MSNGVDYHGNPVAIVERWYVVPADGTDGPTVERVRGYYAGRNFHYRDSDGALRWCESEEVFETPKQALDDALEGVAEQMAEARKELASAMREHEALMRLRRSYRGA